MIWKEHSSEGKHSQFRGISCSALQHTRGHTHTHLRKVIHGLSDQACFEFWSFSYETQLFFISFFVFSSPRTAETINYQKLPMQDNWIQHVCMTALKCWKIITIKISTVTLLCLEKAWTSKVDTNFVHYVFDLIALPESPSSNPSNALTPPAPHAEAVSSN